MADQHRGFFLFRAKYIILLILYVAAYWFLRVNGEIVFQQVAIPGPNGGVELYRMASAHPDIPHWRQQLWRAVFSAAMVGEEEGQPVITRVKSVYRQSQNQNSGRGGNQPSIIDRAAEAGRNLLPGNNTSQAPRQQQQYQQQQYQAQYQPPPTPARQQQFPTAPAQNPGTPQIQYDQPNPAGRGNQPPAQDLAPGERMIFDPRSAAGRR